jgi:two-component system chemotaxis response regulator CheY
MKQKILVADDSPTIRKFVTFTLKMVGFEVISASDGMEAAEMLSQNKFDLIITDLNMPNMDGFELIKVIRQNPEYKETPIIILSSLSDREDVERGIKEGANAYLVKPFEPQRLKYEVAKFLN